MAITFHYLHCLLNVSLCCQQSGFSLLNVSHIDVFNSPDVSDIPWEFASLYAGDCLYLPPGYMHQVSIYLKYDTCRSQYSRLFSCTLLIEFFWGYFFVYCESAARQSSCVMQHDLLRTQFDSKTNFPAVSVEPKRLNGINIFTGR